MFVVIIILISILLFFLIRFLTLKYVIQSMIHRLSEERYEAPITFALVDKDAIELGRLINERIQIHNLKTIEVRRKEEELKELILNITHDLRTPLTAIIGYVRLLETGEIQEENKKYVSIVMEKCKYLNELVSEFYELCLIESGEITPTYREIDLIEILTNNLFRFVDLLENRKIEPEIIQINSIEKIIADELMIERIFNNLISNVIKYGKKNLKIYVETKEFLEVIFENNISDQLLDIGKIFDKFYVGNIDMINRNTGVGLYIAKVLMNKMNGEIDSKLKGDRLQIILRFSRR